MPKNGAKSKNRNKALKPKAPRVKPKKSFIKRIFRLQKNFIADYQDSFEARHIVSDKGLDRNSKGTKFVVMTRVGVSDYGQNKIKNVHIELKIKPKRDNVPLANILKIAPTNTSRIVGTTRGKKERTNKNEINVGAKAEAEIIVPVIASVGGNSTASIERKNLNEEIVTWEYPTSVQVIGSSGVGANAVWDFKQSGLEGWPGQYDLEIIFEIPRAAKFFETEGKDAYEVIPTIIINGQKLDRDKENKVVNPSPLEFIL